MAKAGPDTWSIALAMNSAAHRHVFEDVLAEVAEVITSFETATAWCVTGYAAARPAEDDLMAHVAVAAAAAGADLPEITIALVPDVDWVREVQARFPPIEVGRFFVHGAHYRDVVPPAKIGIRMDAGAAFGTGEHESTRGCLEALATMSDTAVHTALDLGSGSGILAIAIAKLYPARVVAADNDAVAVSVARANAAANGVATRITAVRSDGFRNPALRAHAPYDLIAANILARPLIRTAPTLSRHLAIGGHAVLSGLLVDQEAWVNETYDRCGCTAVNRIAIGAWLTLVLKRVGG